MRDTIPVIENGNETGKQGSAGAPGETTWREIQQQPALWPTTVERVAEADSRLQLGVRLKDARVVLTGAGTSAYAANAVSAGWPGSSAVPSTDLLLDTKRFIEGADVLFSIGRSGNSPESMAVVDRVHRLRPEIWHLAVTCNPEGGLATSPLVTAILLDPRTNDQSLVMTSSFSNLLLAGLCVARPATMKAVTADAAKAAQSSIGGISEMMKGLADRTEDRVVYLASPPLVGWAQEGALKILEMTGGRYAALAETYLGLRHGPMSVVGPSTPVVCLLSNDSIVRNYELDLVRELREKKIGYLVGICRKDDAQASKLFHAVIPPLAPQAPDSARAPFEVVGLQLLGYHLCLRAGLNPDNPSPSGVINRVVQGIRIYN